MLQQQVKPLYLMMSATDSRYIADERPAQSELCVPLIYKERVLGVIDCEHPIKDYFTSAHLRNTHNGRSFTQCKNKPS